MDSSCSKDPNWPLQRLSGRILKGNTWGEGCSLWTLFWLVGGDSGTSGIITISLLVPASLGPGGQWARPNQRYPQIVMDIPGGGAGTLFYAGLLLKLSAPLAWLLFPCFSIPSLPELVTCLSLPFGTQRRPRRLKSFSTNRKQGPQRGFCGSEGPTWFYLVSEITGRRRLV